jgi:hypothetical protein
VWIGHFDASKTFDTKTAHNADIPEALAGQPLISEFATGLFMPSASA